MIKNKKLENIQKNISSIRDRQAKSLRENLIKRKKFKLNQEFLTTN